MSTASDAGRRGGEDVAPAAPLRTTVLVVAGYLALTAWWLWPLPVRMADQAIYPGGTPFIAADLHLITWALAWDTHALLTRPLSLFDANVFHPAPLSLAFSEHFLGYVPLFAPAWLLTGNPVLAANVVIVLSFPLCALAAYALARRFVPPPAAFVAGALFAFHGERYVNLYHLHQLGTWWIPLALLLTERWLERARARDAIALGAVVGLQLLSSFYLAYAIVLFYAAYLPVALLRWRAVLDRRRVLGLGAALIVGAVPAALASLPYLQLQRLGLVPAGQSPTVRLALAGFVTAGRIRRYLTQLGVGPVGYALGAVALLAGWRRSGGYARVVALVAIVTGLVLAAGPEIRLFGRGWWSPYQLLFDWLPGFSAVRLPFRFLVVTQLGFALLAALGVGVLLRLAPGRTAWPVAAVAVAATLATAAAHPAHPLHAQPTPATLPPAYRWLARNGGQGALLELPLIDVEAAAQRMVLSTYHWRPMIDGYSAYPPLTLRFLLRFVVQLPDGKALQELVDHVDVRWILVHLDRMPIGMRMAWELSPPPGLEPVRRWGDDLLFAVKLGVVRDRRALLLRTDRTFGDVPQTRLGDACPGSIEARAGGPAHTVATRRPLAVKVRIVNDGAAALPGFGLYPRHLVQLRSTMRRDGLRIGIPATVPLWADVPAQTSVETGVQLPALPSPGTYQLDLELVQDGESLERCGLRATRLVLNAVDEAGPARGAQADTADDVLATDPP